MTITQFLEQFYPSATEPIWLRTFDAKGLPKGIHGFARKIETCIQDLRTDKALQQRLRTINEKQGIYFVVNAGGNENSDITRINAVYCEIDDLLSDPEESIQAQHKLYDKCPLRPSIRLETFKSVHAYWLFYGLLTVQHFLALQQGLIKFFNSDVSVSNAARVMRVPFFNHVRWDDGYKYRPITVHTCNPETRYSLEQLQATFPYTPPSAYRPRYEMTTGQLDTLDAVKAECRERIMAMDSWTSHGKWGCANGVCHNGQGNTALRIDLASGAITCHSKCDLKTILRAFGLEIPRKDDRKFEYIPKRQQTSELYKWIQSQKPLISDDERESIAMRVEHLPDHIAQKEYERQI